ncbi:MAG: DUF3368 domain-containing protein [Bacteroidia bacterium]
MQSLDLLRTLYGDVFIPPAVKEEINKLGEKGVDISIFQNATWIIIQPPLDHLKVDQLRQKLDQGEAEAIVLAIELHADFLLIDELLGRQEATSQGLAVVGTLGILLKIKQNGYISEIKPMIDTLRSRGFWIQNSLYDHVLRLAGESD